MRIVKLVRRGPEQQCTVDAFVEMLLRFPPKLG